MELESSLTNEPTETDLAKVLVLMGGVDESLRSAGVVTLVVVFAHI